MKYEIEYRKTPIKPGNFIGMNYFAAKSTQHYHHKRIPFIHRHPEHVIEVEKNLTKQTRLNTIHHEEMEEYLMKNKHFSYHHAHKNALRFEELHKHLR
jgi:hypothetical protein